MHDKGKALRDWYAANGMLINAVKSSTILVSHHRKFFLWLIPA